MQARTRAVKAAGATALAGWLAVTAAGCSQSPDNVRAADTDPGGDGVLKVGLLLESTGEQKFLNEAQRAAARLAVQDINDAGGYEGSPVQLLPTQAGEAAAIAARDFINSGADVVIGPTDSSSAPAAIDLLSDASTALISPANSAAALSRYPSDGYYFRTFPSRVLEGRALAQQVRRASPGSVAVLHGGSAYATTVTEALQDGLATRGISSKRIPLAEGRAQAVQEAEAADAVVLVAREQAREALRWLVETGVDPAAVFLGSGATAAFGGDFADGALGGVHGVLAGGVPDNEFQGRLLKLAPDLGHMTFAAEAYDAVVLAALAAADAGDDAGSSIAAHLQEVSGHHQDSPQGEPCGSYSRCLEILGQGMTIDYRGESGPVTFNNDGDIITAEFRFYEYGVGNLPRIGGTIRASLPAEPG
ncbi:ABC transporter substrate-binding protein [Arthrobacter castelli]|uniref:ABC transporter substrate-binding protein n=1 Tax=Arthrobacter castelli TaxID=271431 RepID=UPI000564E6E6|nr:ABC transporter substrate-binding protein [Arthrobacter castelli]